LHIRGGWSWVFENMRDAVAAAVAVLTVGATLVFVRHRHYGQQRRRRTQKRAQLPRAQVLVVVDMQKDYDTEANTQLYGNVQPHGYANPIAHFVDPINTMRESNSWDLVVFTFDWLSADMLAGRTPFCLEHSFGATLLNDLVIDASRDVLFRKSSDDSFCDHGGEVEARTGCDRLGDVLAALGFTPASTSLIFVGQRFERCVLKSVMHARFLGYECSVVMDATFTKTQEPDPEWCLGPADESCSWVEAVFARAKKSAGARLARGYLEAAGVKILPTWPPVP